MKIQHLIGNSYLLETPAISLGVYRFDRHRCLLVDSGEARNASRVLEVIDQQGWQIAAIINTHAHADHCGANPLIAEAMGCSIHASPQEKIFLENPWLIPYTMYSAHPPRSLANRFIMPPASAGVEVLPLGNHEILGRSFRIMDLGGHSPGQIGVITPDGVLYAGDSLLGPGAYHSFPCLLLTNVRQHQTTLNSLQAASYNLLCIAHGGKADEPGTLIRQNISWMENLLDDAIAALKNSPILSREELIESIIQKRKLPVNTTQYYLAWSSLSAVISFLLDDRRIKVQYTPAGIRYKYE